VDRVGLSLHSVDRGSWRRVSGTTGRRSVAALCLAFVCAMLVSCGGELRLVPPAGPSPEVTALVPAGAVATPVSTAVATKVGPIVWATAIDPATGAPIEPVTSYRPDAPQIIAVMQTSGLSAGSAVEATWEYNNTSLDAFSTRLVPAASTEESWISFHIECSPDVPWPAGTYQVMVSLDGTTVQQGSIEVTE